MTPRLRRRLELSGLTWEELSPLLARIRTIDSWARVFMEAAAEREQAGHYADAVSLAFLGQLVLSPYNPEKARIQALQRRCHIRYRSSRPGIPFESLSLCGGAISAYREIPIGSGDSPTVLLMPPLASTKEELTILADALLAAGFPVIRLDLPGQGESPPPLRPDTEHLIHAALEEADVLRGKGVIAGGISLGAYYALRLASVMPDQMRGVFGVSPPAIITPRQWARQPEVIWQYLDIYFATASRAETRQTALGLTLDDTVAHVRCPALLYHGANDRLSLPDAPARYRAALANAAPLTEHILSDGHACLLHLRDRIAPEVAKWATEQAIREK